ncbi:hypothetical protein GQ53DRAFT_826912 [Thozetella sp. PMI_491]|nr:hypothetical protein GQ53DRAFT_826912 [Thozetella sp. PMI_491]
MARFSLFCLLAAWSASQVHASWSEGENCYKTACLPPDQIDLPDGQSEVAAAGIFRDNCPNGQYRVVACPSDEIPVDWSCQWSTDTNCPAGKTSIATRNLRHCLVQGNGGCLQYNSIPEAYCCDPGLPQCNWADCFSGNTCGTNQVEVALDNSGTSGLGCSFFFGFQGPPQELCCGDALDTNPFLPVDLSWLYPTLPPDTDIPRFEFEHIESQLNKAIEVGPLQPFGFIVIDGPNTTVANMAKRDGSHIEFLDCEPSTKQDLKVYTARYLCMNDSDESNCDDVHLEGAEGTIVKLPEECGYASYGVVHEIKPSEDTRVPHELRKRAPVDGVVHEVTFSYDFTRVKRATADDPVYVRIDYGSQAEWFQQAVNSPPAKKRSEGGTLKERFWSNNEALWAQKIANTRASTNAEDNELLPIFANFSQLIYQQTSSTCGPSAGTIQQRAVSDDGYLSVLLSGYVIAQLRWGFSMVGTISPTLHLEEAHGFFDTQFTSAGQLWVDGSGVLDIPVGTPREHVLSADVVDFNYTHPGIATFNPRLNVAVQLLPGGGEFNGNFTVNFVTLPSANGSITTNSAGMGDFTGSLGNQALHNAFNGAVDAALNNNSASDGVIFAARITPQSWMEITVFENGPNGGADGTTGTANFTIEIPRDIIVRTDEGTVSVVDAYPNIMAEVFSTNISTSWEADAEQHLLDPGNEPFVVFEENTGQGPAERIPPNIAGNPVLQGNYVTCNGTATVYCYPPSNISTYDPDILNDFDGENADSSVDDNVLTGRAFYYAPRFVPGKFGRDLEERATAPGRPFDVTLPNGGGVFTTTSSQYITGGNGNALLAVNPQAGRYNVEDAGNCESNTVTTQGSNSDQYASEHILELNTFPEAWSFMLSGRVPPTTQSAPYSTRFSNLVVPVNLMGPTSVFTQNWAAWDPNAPPGTHSDVNQSPERAIWEAMGSLLNPGVLVNAERVINGFKSRMWRAINAISEDRWTTNSWDDTTAIAGVVHANEAISELRLFPFVINYLNEQVVNQNLINVANRIDAIFQEFDAAIARNNLNNGAATGTSTLWREFFYNVVIRRLEGAQGRYRELIWRMIDNWQNALVVNNPPQNSQYYADIQQILTSLREMRDNFDPVNNPNEFKVNTNGLFPNPAPRR